MIKPLVSIYHLKYRLLLKPLFFMMDAEQVHNGHLKLGKTLGKIPLIKDLLQIIFSYQHPSLERRLNGITFPNPVGLSAGFDYNGDLTDILPALGFGFHTIGTITYQPYQGNPKPRLGRLPASKALIVNKGLKNIGVKALIRKLSDKKFEIPTGISIASTNKHFNSTKEQMVDILASFKILEESNLRHDYYELNISCPNTFGGEPFTTPDRLRLLLICLDKLKISRPVYIKMPIDLSEKEALQLLKVIEKHKVEGVNFGNLTKDKNNPDLTSTDRKTWQEVKGNLSGKPTWKRSNKLVALVKQHYQDRFTIIGTGGIFSGQDANHKIKQGADLVSLIAGMVFEGPQLIGQINSHLANKAR